jgi:hypothetical protein
MAIKQHRLCLLDFDDEGTGNCRESLFALNRITSREKGEAL